MAWIPFEFHEGFSEKELQDAVARFSLDEYPHLDCPDYSVCIGKQELNDLRVIAGAYMATTSKNEPVVVNWHVQENEGWFY